jgi:Xaa-Pro dipeptidase
MQAFETSEFTRRLYAVQAEMNRQDLSVLAVFSPEQIYYLSGYQTSGYFAYQALVIPQAGDPILSVRYIEKGNIPEYSWLPDGDYWKDNEDYIAKTAAIVRSLCSETARVGYERDAWFLKATELERFQNLVGRDRLIDAGRIVDEVRLIKSSAEIAYIRKAAEIAEIEVRAAIDAIDVGVTEADLAAAVHFAGISAGCEYTGLPHHIQSGHRREVGHANWSRKRIERGEIIRLEIYGCVERYHATVVRPVFMGEPTDDAKRIRDLIITAQDNALSALKPGASSRTIDALVRGPIRTVRPDYYNRTGYSTGIGFPPKTAEWETREFNEYCDWEVKAGMTFHMLTAALGIGFSETVVVTENGAERLTSTLPRDLFVVS